MSSVEAEGTQLCVINTEHELVNTSLVGSFVLILDLAALAQGDVVTVRLKRKVRSSTTLREAFRHTFYGARIVAGDEPVAQSVPIASPGHQLVATLQQTLGTGRSFPWSLERV